jgi:hypothetical protein
LSTFRTTAQTSQKPKFTPLHQQYINKDYQGMHWQERVRKQTYQADHKELLKNMSLKFGQFSMRDKDVE